MTTSSMMDWGPYWDGNVPGMWNAGSGLMGNDGQDQVTMQ